jgi:DNA-binding MarR family transcriptional regulator
MPPPLRPGPQGGGIAFLLSQLGAHSSEQFALALAEHDLNPALVGILRQLMTGAGGAAGPSQQQLAERLGLVPSRIVSYVDELESRGWIARTRDPVDRRVNVLTVTEAGREAFRAIATIAREHETRMTDGLDDADRGRLLELLTKLAAARELTEGVHPGYRKL